MAGLALLACAAPSHAFVIGPSNLGVLSEYQKPNCYFPIRPTSYSSRLEIETYQDMRRRYVDCVNDYLKAAELDMQRIQEAYDQAAADAKFNLSH